MPPMFGPNDDPRDIPELGKLDIPALERAINALKHLDQFHTIDITTHMHSLQAHREFGRTPEFFQLVTYWLNRNATLLGLRGPLPGHASRGDRWAWYEFAKADFDDA